MSLWDLKIIVFCFHVHFTQHLNFLGIRAAHEILLCNLIILVVIFTF